MNNFSVQQLTKNHNSLWIAYKKHVRQVVLGHNPEDLKKVSHWRNSGFCTILTYLTPLSIIALVPSVIMAFLNGVPVVGFTDLFIFLTAVLITLVPGIKLETRKALFIFLLYYLSVILLYYLPMPGPGLLFLLTVTIFSSLIYSSAAAYYSAWSNTAICICYGGLIYFEIGSPVASGYTTASWTAVSSNLILLSFACAKSLDLLLAGLTNSLNANNVSEAKLEKANRHYQFISQINQSIVYGKDVETLFRNACSIAFELGKYKMAWIGGFDAAQNKITQLYSSGIAGQDIEHLADLHSETNELQAYVLRTGKYFISNDIGNTLELENCKPLAEKQSIGSCIILPIKKSGCIFGTFNLYATETNYFDDDDIALLLEVTSDLSFALDYFEKAKGQKEAEELVLKNEKLFRAITEASSDMKTLATADGKMTYASPSVTNVLGYTVEEFLEMHALNLIHPEDMPMVGQKINDVLQTPGKSFTNQHRLLHKNGNWIWTEGTLTNLLHESGIEALVSNFKDISQKREAELALQKSHKELETVYEEQTAILNTLPASIALIDHEGNIVKVNDEWIHFGQANGLPDSYLHVGKNYINVSEKSLGIDAKGGQEMAQGLQQILGGTLEHFTMEYPCNSQIENRWFKTEVRPFKSNLLTGAVIMHINISERKKAETEMSLLVNNTEESFVLLNKNLAIVSFNNQFSTLYKKYFGLEIEKGRSILDYAQPDRKETVAAIYQKVLRGHAKESEIKIPLDNSITKHFSIKYKPATDESEQIVGVFVTAIDITAKKKAEEQKEFERRDKETLINNTDDLIWSVSKDFRLIAGNRSFINQLKKYTGIEIRQGDELLKNGMYPADYLSYWKELYSRALTGESYKIEIHTPPAGVADEWWIETNFNPIIIKEQIVGTACYTRNITERKKSELLIRANEARLAEAQSLAKIGNWEIDLVKLALLWSAQTSRIFDFERDAIDLSHEVFLSLVHPDDRKKVEDAFNYSFGRNLDKKAVNTIEHRIITKNGEEKTVEERWQILYDETGTAIKAVGTCQDITERKKSEQENKFKAVLLDTIGQAVLATDMLGTVTFWNKAATEIYGWTWEEAIGANIIELTPSTQSKEDAEELMKKLSQGEGWSGEFYVRRKNGVQFPAYVFNSPVFDEFGIQRGIIGVSSDISERKENELERLKITNDLLQRNRDLEQFTFIISHNLRAPTANIIGITSILQSDSLSSEEHNELLKALSTSVGGLDNIIKDINSILQVKKEVNEKKEHICFSKLVKDITVSIGNIIDKYQVRIESDFSNVDDFFSLKVYLHSIFYNLISNSIKYCKPGEHPLIEIKSKRESGKIVLTFKDNGLGIDLKTKGDKVFGLYKRFHSHVEGKGMGLFMVKTQVEAIGGKITVASELNKGTKFTIVLENSINQT